jgi:hypothetical protein
MAKQIKIGADSNSPADRHRLLDWGMTDKDGARLLWADVLLESGRVQKYARLISAEMSRDQCLSVVEEHVAAIWKPDPSRLVRLPCHV